MAEVEICEIKCYANHLNMMKGSFYHEKKPQVAFPKRLDAQPQLDRKVYLTRWKEEMLISLHKNETKKKKQKRIPHFLLW